MPIVSTEDFTDAQKVIFLKTSVLSLTKICKGKNQEILRILTEVDDLKDTIRKLEVQLENKKRQNKKLNRRIKILGG